MPGGPSHVDLFDHKPKLADLRATERLLERLARTSTNEEFLTSLKTDL